MTRASAVAAACLTAAVLGCTTRPPCSGAACAAGCPRDASLIGGRCACKGAALPVLGACLPLAEADAFCGTGGRASAAGCAFRSCEADEVLDLADGRCKTRSLVLGVEACGHGAAPIVEESRDECVPAGAACPRGTETSASADAAGLACEGPPACPPGSVLSPGGRCWPVVTNSPRGPLVDIGSWVLAAFGPDGGLGTDMLCRPLAQHPTALGVAPGHALDVSLRIALAIPDQDLTRIDLVVTADDVAADAPLSPAGDALVRTAVGSLVESLRSLGGEASASAVNVVVRCTVRSL